MSKRIHSSTRLGAVFGLAMLLLPLTPQTAKAGTDPLIGELMLFGGNFCPRGWANADGTLLPISQNSALFSIFGTMYGGDGRTTFALPDLRGRAPIHLGNGPGLPSYTQGQKGGATSFTLTVAQLPSHNHLVNAVAQLADKGGPGTDFLGIPEHYNRASTQDDISIYHNGPADRVMDPAMISNTGGDQAVNHRGPYLTLRWCVALQGVFPSRN